MRKLQLIILFLILGVFGAIFWIVQKDSLSKAPPPFPFPSIPEIEDITPLDSINQKPQETQQQTPEVQGPVKEDMRATISAQIKTSKGDIEVVLYNQEANLAVKNFINKARRGFYTNKIFHRVEDWVIQGGDPLGNGTGGGAFQSELNGKPFVAGSLGYAASSAMQVGQGARISNDSQFFIVKQDATWLDQTYTNFGIVTEGMDVVNSINVGDKILGITIQ